LRAGAGIIGPSGLSLLLKILPKKPLDCAG
jgi:hypothetical protein